MQLGGIRLGEGQGPLIALYNGRTPPADVTSHWFLVIDVDDLETAAAHLRAAGVKVGATEDVPYGRAARFRDPEGNVIQIHSLTTGS